MTTFKNNYNKANIFKQAHAIAKKQGIAFAEALQKAWFLAKRYATIKRTEFNLALRKAGLAPAVNMIAEKVAYTDLSSFYTNGYIKND
jgi:hypothetical protein